MTRTKQQGVRATLTARSRHLVGAVTIAMVAATFTLGSTPAASADTKSIDFEAPTYSIGNIDGQDGWTKTGSYDAAVVDSTTFGTYPMFGTQSLRVSNAVTSGSFGDQTFSTSLVDEAGETDAVSGGFSGGVRQSHYDASFDLASTMPTEQSGMAMSVSPDRGDGARMSYLRFVDQSDGIHVFFDDYVGDFTDIDIATLDRAPHTIRFSMDLVDGPSNDVVNIYIDGSLVHTGTSWEDYYRFVGESLPSGVSRTVDSLLFRTGGTAVPANAGNGFLFDNVELTSSMTATLGDCSVAVTGTNPTVYTLLADCTTDQTIVVPQNAGGSVFDGNGYSITAVDPTGGHFLGAVVQAQAGSSVITVENLTVKASNLATACDAGNDRLRGILFDGVSGTITNNTVTDIEQGTTGDGCQEGNAIDVRNSAGVTPMPKITITDNVVTNYQKTGIIATLSTAATIMNNTVTGYGPVTFIAQNGIQVSLKATAKLVGNDVSDNDYSPSKVTACGLLIYKAGGVSGATKSGIAFVKADNDFHANEQNICNFGKGGSFSPAP